jgi:glycine cleavage system H lipoate-binding protein
MHCGFHLVSKFESIESKTWAMRLKALVSGEILEARTEYAARNAR